MGDVGVILTPKYAHPLKKFGNWSQPESRGGFSAGGPSQPLVVTTRLETTRRYVYLSMAVSCRSIGSLRFPGNFEIDTLDGAKSITVI